MTPFDDFVYIVNHILLGDEPTIEDFILLVGTLVAFIAFVLWCCFPVQPRDATTHRQFCGKGAQNSMDSQLQQSNYSKTAPIDYGHHCCT